MFCSASSARPANATRGEVKINSQSLEDTQVMYILQKYTLDKYTLDKYALENTPSKHTISENTLSKNTQNTVFGFILHLNSCEYAS